MPSRSIGLVPCTYLGYSGAVCGRGCYSGICYAHAARNPHVPCINCGRGTFSVTGYCSAKGGCITAQQRLIKTPHPRAGKAKPPPMRSQYWDKPSKLDLGDAELDQFVDDLLAEIKV